LERKQARHARPFESWRRFLLAGSAVVLGETSRAAAGTPGGRFPPAGICPFSLALYQLCATGRGGEGSRQEASRGGGAARGYGGRETGGAGGRNLDFVDATTDVILADASRAGADVVARTLGFGTRDAGNSALLALLASRRCEILIV